MSDLRPEMLGPLFAEQAAEWRQTLLWDFLGTAQRLFFMAELRALAGVALADENDRVVGYACYDRSADRVESTNFYISPAHRSLDTNTELLRRLLEHLRPGVERITVAPALPHQIEIGEFTYSPRVYHLAAEAASIARVCQGFRDNQSTTIAVRGWEDADLDAAAAIMTSSYYKNVPHDDIPDAQAKLESVIYIQETLPFLPEASVVAFDRESGKLRGFALACHAMEGVAFGGGLCVERTVASHRLGDRLCAELCLALAWRGYHTLTLRRQTTDPRLARFYARMGFVKQFNQIVYEWEPKGVGRD